MKLLRGMFLLLWVCFGVWVIKAQDDPNCVGAPLPRLVIGEEGRVVPGDANNMRDSAGLGGARSGKIPAGSVFSVLAGPVCADGLNWWQVSYDGLTGWTVEGQVTEYWVEPVAPAAPLAASNTPAPPTNTPVPTSTPAPAVVFAPPLDVVNRLGIGVRARVISGSTRLIVRSSPGLYSESLSYVEDGALVTVVDGPRDADSYLWWQIETENGQIGWVIEGTSTERALLPLCPLTENRVAFVVKSYLYTADESGANRCIFDRIGQTDYMLPLPKNLMWSLDRQWLTFVDYELYQISANGGQRIRLTDKSSLLWVNRSPDGERFVTVDMRDRFQQVWTQRVDGSLLAALTTGSEKKIWAEWLADSETVVYVERLDGTSLSDGYIFYSVNILTGGLKQIFGTTLSISMPVLSADRSRLLVSGEDRAAGVVAGGRTYILDTLTGDVLLEFPFAFNGFWSPDGTRLISLEAEAISTLSLVPGSEPTRAALSMPLPPTDGNYVYTEWLPDGRLRVIINGVFYYVDTLTAQVEQGAS